MRAVHAAKDLQGTAAHVADLLDEVVAEISRCINEDNDIGTVDGAWVESFAKYTKEMVLPVLKLLLKPLCANRPANPRIAAFSILAADLGVPEDVLSGLASFIDGQPKPPAEPPSPNRVPARPSLMKRASTQPWRDEAATEVDESGVQAAFTFAAAAFTEVVAIASQLESPFSPTSIQSAPTERNAERTRPQSSQSVPDQKSAGATTEPEQKKTLKNLMLPQRSDERRLSNADRLWDVIRKSMERPEIMRKEMGVNFRKRTEKLLTRQIEFDVAVVGKEMPLEQKITYLRLVPMLRKYSEDELAQVAKIAKLIEFRTGDHFVQFGKECDQLHIITEGTGRVSVPNYAGVVKTGEFIGEDSLRTQGATNTFDISAVGGNVTTLTISRSDFDELPIKKHMDRRTKAVAIAGDSPGGSKSRSSVSSVQEEQVICPDTKHAKVMGYEKTQADREEIIMAVSNNKVMSDVMGLSEEQCGLISDSVHLIEVAANTPVFLKGDKGTALFILKVGLLKVTLPNGRELTVTPGTAIGELALLYDEPRSATIDAVVESRLWVLPRRQFKSVSKMSANKRLKQYAQMLSKIPVITSRVDTSLLEVVAEVLEETCIVEGEDVCTAGEDDGTLFLLFEGECECTGPDGGEPLILKEGDWIGEEQIAQGIAADRTLTVTSEVATVLVLSDVAFQIVEEATKTRQSDKTNKLTEMGGLQSVTDKTMRQHLHEMQAIRRGAKLARNASRDQMADQGSDSKAVIALRRCEVVGGLGEGSFGLVVLLRDRISQQEYALKGLAKSHLKRANLEEMVQNERAVMMLMDSDFVVRLHHSFEDPQHLYLLLDPAMGGELFDVYQDNGLFGSVKHAMFYIACVSLGLAHMHAKRVIWRDLKLENCLLNSQGYLKLTDMGIAKLAVGKTYSVCGTADYLAPETLRQTGHNRAVDWWAAGVLLFIMLSGRSPFDAPEAAQIYKNIIKGMNKVEFPKTCSPEAEELIRALCMKKPEDRIAMQKGGVVNLMSAPFFQGFDWEELKALKMAPPFVPASPNYEEIAAKKFSRAMDIQWEDLKEMP